MENEIIVVASVDIYLERAIDRGGVNRFDYIPKLVRDRAASNVGGKGSIINGNT
jgi:hypothetical protein